MQVRMKGTRNRIRDNPHILHAAPDKTKHSVVLLVPESRSPRKPECTPAVFNYAVFIEGREEEDGDEGTANRIWNSRLAYFQGRSPRRPTLCLERETSLAEDTGFQFKKEHRERRRSIRYSFETRKGRTRGESGEYKNKKSTTNSSSPNPNPKEISLVCSYSNLSLVILIPCQFHPPPPTAPPPFKFPLTRIYHSCIFTTLRFVLPLPSLALPVFTSAPTHEGRWWNFLVSAPPPKQQPLYGKRPLCTTVPSALVGVLEGLRCGSRTRFQTRRGSNLSWNLRRADVYRSVIEK